MSSGGMMATLISLGAIGIYASSSLQTALVVGGLTGLLAITAAAKRSEEAGGG